VISSETLVKVVKHFDEINSVGSKLNADSLFRVTVTYRESRLNHPVGKFFEPLLVLVRLFFFWCHFVWRGGFKATMRQ
jgi:hypothetical protein